MDVQSIEVLANWWGMIVNVRGTKSTYPKTEASESEAYGVQQNIKAPDRETT